MKTLRLRNTPAVGVFAGCLLGVAFLAPALQAQITHTVNLSGVTFQGGDWMPVFNPGDLPAGSDLVSVSIDVRLDATGGDPGQETYANDLSVYVGYPAAGHPFGFSGGPVQIGGFSTHGLVKLDWANGNSPVVGTTVIDTKNAGGGAGDIPVGIDLNLWTLYIGNGFENSNTTGTWTGTVTLEYVPEPHQYAVMAGLGLIGFAATRRYLTKRG